MLKNNAQFRIIEDGTSIGENTNVWNFTHVRATATIGDNCNIGNNAYIDSHVKIGNNVKIQNSVNIYHGVTLEDDVFVGPSVTFTNDMSPRAFIWSDEKITPTLVKKGTSIGANATIRCGITLGEYSMIGAGSVVTRDIPTHCLAVGNPAKITALVSKDGDIVKDFSSYITKQTTDTLHIEFEGKEITIEKKNMK